MKTPVATFLTGLIIGIVIGIAIFQLLFEIYTPLYELEIEIVPKETVPIEQLESY